MELLLKPREVAYVLNVSPQTARNYIKQGKLPAVRVGGQWRVRKSDLDEYIKKRSKNEAARRGEATLDNIPLDIKLKGIFSQS